MSRYATSEAARAAQAEFDAAFDAHVADCEAHFAALTEEPPFDVRHGTVRGFLAALAIVLLLPFIGALL